jgi:hypothetical protein
MDTAWDYPALITSRAFTEWARRVSDHPVSGELWASDAFRVIDSGGAIDPAVDYWPPARLAERIGSC